MDGRGGRKEGGGEGTDGSVVACPSLPGPCRPLSFFLAVLRIPQVDDMGQVREIQIVY